MPSHRAGTRRESTAVKLALTLVLMAAIGAVVGFGTWSAFSSTTSNTGNTFESGTVVLADNDDPDGAGPLGSTPMLSFSNATPGGSDTSCIEVTYTGTLPANVRMYGTTGGSGLDTYLNLTVTRGSGAAGFDDCSGFTPDATDYDGAGPNGNGVVYSGTLQDFPDGYDDGVVDPTAGWGNGESHQYQLVVTLASSAPEAQGKSATQTFAWEAQNA